MTYFGTVKAIVRRYFSSPSLRLFVESGQVAFVSVDWIVQFMLSRAMLEYTCEGLPWDARFVRVFDGERSFEIDPAQDLWPAFGHEVTIDGGARIGPVTFFMPEFNDIVLSLRAIRQRTGFNDLSPMTVLKQHIAERYVLTPGAKFSDDIMEGFAEAVRPTLAWFHVYRSLFMNLLALFPREIAAASVEERQRYIAHMERYAQRIDRTSNFLEEVLEWLGVWVGRKHLPTMPPIKRERRHSVLGKRLSFAELEKRWQERGDFYERVLGAEEVYELTGEFEKYGYLGFIITARSGGRFVLCDTVVPSNAIYILLLDEKARWRAVTGERTKSQIRRSANELDAVFVRWLAHFEGWSEKLVAFRDTH